MANTNVQYLDLTGLQAYDTLVKAWANSANQAGYKTILKSTDGNTLNLYKKPNATSADTPDATVPLGSADVVDQLTALGNIVGVTYNSSTKTYSAPLGATFDANTTDLVKALNELKGQIDVLNGADTTAGSVSKAIKDAIGALDTNADVAVATKSGNSVTLTGSIAEADGIIAKGSGTDITLADVAATGAAADVSVADTNNKITATNVEGALEELVDAIADATDASKVTCETSEGAAGTDTLKTYSFYQGVLSGDDAAAKASKKIIDINIPKDYVVRSATVGTATVANTPVEGLAVGDKYIDLAINTNDGTGSGTVRHLYIPFKELMDAVKGSTGTEITVAVSGDNTISATIVKVSATKIEYKAETSEGANDAVTVKAALDTLNGDNTTAGSVAKAQKDAIDIVVGTNADAKTANTVYGAKAYADAAIGDLNTTTEVGIASVTGNTVTIGGSIAEANGIVQAGTADGVTIAPVATADINALFE